MADSLTMSIRKAHGLLGPELLVTVGVLDSSGQLNRVDLAVADVLSAKDLEKLATIYDQLNQAALIRLSHRETA